MNELNKILEMYPDEGYEKVNGFDYAIIGVSSCGRLVYSIQKIIEVLMGRNNWSEKDANDYFYYNIECSYNGDKARIFINLIND